MEKNTNTEQAQNVDHGSAAFVAKYAGRDLQAGVITATMAIPLSIGIAMMSDYPCLLYTSDAADEGVEV